ncbi:MAG: DNA alkylation repair protein [Deltaproteobacteria bacterium]|nr:DNA alkylation repair protein [Deltaproteobacteria bacterium]
MNGKLLSIQNELRKLGNKKIAEHSQRFFKTGKGEYGEGDRFLGVRVPVLRKLARKYQGISIEQASRLLKSQFHEERLLSLLMLINIFKKTNEEDKEFIYTLYLNNAKFINNWDIVDCSAEHIVGAYLRERNKQPIYNLADSKSLWERRISIMSTFHFIKNNEFVESLRVSEILLHDKEDLIHKAVGWMLREIGKRNIMVEEGFLKKHCKTMPRTMLRYAIEKFPKERRKKYLRLGRALGGAL